MSADTELPRRIVCVTGGARGLGAAIVRGFARQGADVHVCDILQRDGDDLVGSLIADVGTGEAAVAVEARAAAAVVRAVAEMPFGPSP